MAIDFWDRLFRTEEHGRVAMSDSGFAVGGMAAALMLYARGEIATLADLAALVKDCNGDPLTVEERTEAKKLTDRIDAQSNATTKALEALRIEKCLYIATCKYEFDRGNPDRVAAGLAERAAIFGRLGVVDPKV